jgi:hypothetical protein
MLWTIFIILSVYSNCTLAKVWDQHRWAKLLCLLSVNSLSYFVKIKY